MLIDTHCHVDQFSDPEALVAKCEAANVKVVAVTNLPSHYGIALPHLSNSKHVYPAMGFHPLSVTNNSGELRIFEKYASEAKFIGEIGLDFSKVGLPTRQQQEEIFDSLLSVLRKFSGFVTLHSRGAEREVLEGLKRHRICKACFHWYSGGIRVLEEILSCGYFISINPAMLGTQKGKKILDIVPPTQLLAESDGPYAKLNRKPCSPLDVVDVYQAISRRHQLGPDEVDHMLEGNFRRASNK